MATVYISPTGDDSRTYVQAQSISTPWATPAKVYSTAVTGDTAICLNGTYTIGASIAASKNITWQAQTDGSVIWDDNHAQHQVQFTTDNITTSFTGIKFYRWKYTNGNLAPIFRVSISASASATVTFTRCVFDSMIVKDDGSLGIGGLFGVTGNGTSQTVTVSLDSCRISNVTYLTTQTNTAIFATRADANSVQTFNMNKCTVYLPSTTNAIASIIKDTSADRVDFAGKNNIIYAGTAITWGATSSTMTYSDGYNITSFPANTGNITSDPLFVDAANENYNLRATSPCLNTGTLL